MKILATLALALLLTSRALSAAPLESTRRNLDNGVTFVALPDRTSPRVSISVLLRVGAAQETPDSAGWRRLLLDAMLSAAPSGFETTGGLESEALARAAQERGGQISGSVGDDLIEISVSGDSSNQKNLLELALALIQKPRLSDEDLDKARERQRDQLEAEEFDLSARVSASLREQLFRGSNGDLEAYGLPDYGTTDSLKTLDNVRLRELYSTQIAPAKITVSAAGDLDAGGLEAILRGLATVRPSSAPRFPIFKPLAVGAAPLVVREFPTRAASVFVSYPISNLSSSEAPTLRVLVAALAESNGARLPKRVLGGPLVDGAPVAQTVAAQWVYRRYASELLISSQTGAQNVERVKNALIDEVQKLQSRKLTSTELQNAKNYARGSWSIERQNLRERAFLAGQPTALGAPDDSTWLDRLNAVSSEQVAQLAKKIAKTYVVALVMPKLEEED